MGDPPVTVLLVSGTSQSASSLEHHLLKCGCTLWFAFSKKEAIDLLQHRQFDLVLSDFMLPDGTAYELMAPLLGTATTMFFSNAFEDSCWWMTAIFRGQDRSDEPGMQPREFTMLLDKVLSGKLLQSGAQAANRSVHAEKDEARIAG